MTLEWAPLLALLDAAQAVPPLVARRARDPLPRGRAAARGPRLRAARLLPARARSRSSPTIPVTTGCSATRSNASSGPFDPVAYYGHVREVLDLVEEHTEPGALREQLLAHWYRGKTLGRVGGRGFAQRGPELRRAMFEEIRRLAAERYDWDVERFLDFGLRLRSRLVRAGAFEALEELAEWESGIRARVKLHEVRPQGRGVLLRVEARLEPRDGWLAFRRGDRTLTLMAPDAVAAAAGEEALEAEMDNDVELFLRSLDDGSEYTVRTDARTRLKGARAGTGVTPEQHAVAWGLAGARRRGRPAAGGRLGGHRAGLRRRPVGLLASARAG